MCSLKRDVAKWKKIAIDISRRERESRLTLTKVQEQETVAWLHTPSEKLLWPEEVAELEFDIAAYTPLVERIVGSARP